MATGPVIVPENLGDEILESVSSDENGKPRKSKGPDTIESFVQAKILENSDDIYAETLAMMEQKLITKILTATQGNQSKAAEMLGITRGSLRNKIRTLGIVIEQVVATQ